jgi:hypothetical protein
MSWKSPLAEQLKHIRAAMKEANDNVMRAAGYVWVDDEETPKPKPPAPVIQPRPETREELVARLWKGKDVELYRGAKVQPSQYYAWRRGELRDGSAVDIRIRRFLNTTK